MVLPTRQLYPILHQSIERTNRIWSSPQEAIKESQFTHLLAHAGKVVVSHILEYFNSIVNRRDHSLIIQDSSNKAFVELSICNIAFKVNTKCRVLIHILAVPKV
jgi:hypothetical protein